MHVALILGGVAIFASVASAQNSNCTQRAFVVSAVSSEGNAVRDLTADALKSETKPAVPQVRALRTADVGHVVVMLDVSRSMREDPKIETASNFVIEAVRALPSGWRIEIVLFGDGHRQYTDLTLRRGEVGQILANLLTTSGLHGRTAMFDAIQESLVLFRGSHGSKTILIVTDGADNSSRASLSALERSLLQDTVRLFAAVLTNPLRPGFHRSHTEFEVPTELRDLAEVSGGTISYWRRGPQIATEELRDFVDLLAAAYLVEIEIAEQPLKPARWKLEFTPEAKKKWKGATLLYPRKILPCAPAAASK